MAISFEKGKKKTREKEDFQKLQDNFHLAAENLKEDDSEENFHAFLNAMSDMAGHILSRPGADGIMKREEEERKRFYERYRDVFSIVPISDIGKIQHYTKAMLRLVPDIFYGDWKTRFDSYMDFQYIHLNEFDAVHSKMLKRNVEPDYPFQFKLMELNLLEESLNDCLNRIIALCSENENADETEILYQASRLFELTEILGDVFTDELRDREKTEERI